LYAPLHVLRHDKSASDDARAQDTYDKVVGHYENLLKQLGPIEASTAIKHHLAFAHLAFEQHELARMEWLSIQTDFPKSPYGAYGILSAAETAWRNDDVEQALKDYDQYFALYPNHSMAKSAAQQVGVLHERRKEHEQAREWYTRAIQFSQDESSVAALQILIGKSFQYDDKWEEASAVYRDIEAHYAHHPFVLEIPLMTAIHHQTEGEDVKSLQILDEALTLYQNEVDQAPGSERAAYARQLRHHALVQKGDWAAVMANLDVEMSNSQVDQVKGRWFFLKGLIAQNHMKDNEKAISIYDNFLEKYPDHPLIPLAEYFQALLSTNQVIPGPELIATPS
jgi:outer membrane protein assembly factor BamD (BamD/ComL family)